MEVYAEKSRKQNETIQQLCVNRKVEVFDYIKEWDCRRAQRLTLHRQIIDQFDESLQSTLAESVDYIHVVRQFLTDILNQRKKYEEQIVCNPETKINANLVGKSLHAVNSREISKLFNVTNNNKSYKKLKVLLEEGLTKLQHLLAESQRQIMELRTKIEVSVVTVQDNNVQTQRECDRLVEVYSKDKLLRPFQSECDLYCEVKSFILQAQAQTDAQRELGMLTVVYINYVEHLERQKLIAIKEVIGSYLQQTQKQIEDEQTKSLKDILNKTTDNEYIQICYSAQELLAKDLIRKLASMMNKHEKEINLKMVKNYLSKFECEQFEKLDILVLKEYRAYQKIDEQLQGVVVIVTVDGFINMMLLETQQQLPVYSARVDHNLKLIREGDLNIVLASKKWKGFKQPKESDRQRVTLLFNSEDQRDEFNEFIDRITK